MVLAQGSIEGRADVFTTQTPVKLAVTGENPPQGTITVVLWEFDPPRAAGAIDTNEPTRRDLIVAIQGTVVARVGTKAGFEFKPLPTHVWQPVAAGPRTFELEIDGTAGRHRVAIPPDAGEDQADLYGAAWKVMIRVVRGTPPTGPTSPMSIDDKPDIDRIFDSRSWVLLRDFRNFHGDHRPVVAIIAVPTSGDGYGSAALEFWRDHADVLHSIQTLEEVLQFLRAEQEWGVGTIKRDWALGPWGEVNIIAHGWLAAWNVAIFRGGIRHPDLRHSRDEWTDRFTLERAIELEGRGKLRPPSDKLLDAQSHVVIRGCVLGRDALLAQLIHRIFGGTAPTHVGRLIGAYGHHPDHPDRNRLEAFAYECWVHVRRASAPRPPDADLIDYFIRKYDKKPTDASQPGFIRADYHQLVTRWQRRGVSHRAAAASPVFRHLPLDGLRGLHFEVQLADHPHVAVRLENKSVTEREAAVLAAWRDMFDAERDSGRHENLFGTQYDDWAWHAAYEVDGVARKFVVSGNAQVLLWVPHFRDYAQPTQPMIESNRDDERQYVRVG